VVAIDYDTTPATTVKELEVRAYDADRTHSVTVAITVNIDDVNDNAPACPSALIT
jgi:hypothetical protein